MKIETMILNALKSKFSQTVFSIVIDISIKIIQTTVVSICSKELESYIVKRIHSSKKHLGFVSEDPIDQ